MIKIFNVIPNLYLPKKITIVGSSKIILKEKNGKKIDESDFVVRFNFANTSEFTEYTGSKTSLMIINNHVYTSLKDTPKIDKKINKYLVISPSVLKKFKSMSDYFFFEKKINQFLLSLKFIKYFNIFFSLIKILIRKNFSIGFCFILLAVASGLNLEIYGFDLNEDMDKREHYYKKQKIGGRHDLSGQHEVLKKLKDLGLINFLQT